MLPDPVWAYENYMAVANGGQPNIIVADMPNSIWWEMKSSKGYPVDQNSWDEQWIYQTRNSNDWANASNYSAFTKPIIWAPRYWTPGQVYSPIQSASEYTIYEDCKPTATIPLGSVGGVPCPVETSIQFASGYKFGGTLGTRAALVLFFKWGPGFSTLEINHYILNRGRVRWESQNLVNGQYVSQNVSLFNTVVKSRTPKLYFPCGPTA
jgi:hypothetical protein